MLCLIDLLYLKQLKENSSFEYLALSFLAGNDLCIPGSLNILEKSILSRSFDIKLIVTKSPLFTYFLLDLPYFNFFFKYVL